MEKLRFALSAPEDYPNIITHLKYLISSYNQVKRTLAANKNRAIAMINEVKCAKDAETLDEIKPIASAKRKLASLIEGHCIHWDLWNRYLVNVPGIGPAIGGRLILAYYYRFIPVCADCGATLEKIAQENGNKNQFICSQCGKKPKGQGVLTHRIELKDFPTPSSWWSHMAGINTKDGSLLKRKKGQQANFSPKRRSIVYDIGAEFNWKDPEHLYKAFYNGLKGKGKPHRMALFITARLFLLHMWEVARTIDGLPIRSPYIEEYGGHVTTKPFYWKP